MGACNSSNKAHELAAARSLALEKENEAAHLKEVSC